MHSNKCQHSSHGFKIYGTTVYKDSTCAKCILSAYNHSRKEKIIVEDEKPLYSKKNKHPNPFTDTVSHYPSPGGEAEQGIFKPHTPLVNAEEEVRPSDVLNLCEKLRKTSMDDFQKSNDSCEEPSDIIIEEKECSDSDFSMVKQKRKDFELGKSLLEDRENLRKLATQQFYKTSTQRFYEGSDWSKIISKGKRSPVLPLPKNDRSELEGQIRRYNKSTESYQKLNELTNWDRVQTRQGFFVKRPISFISESKKIIQIPDYKGTTGGFGEKDVENESFTPLTVVRTEQPKFSTPGWKPFIPGYTGHVAYNKVTGLFSNEPLPRLESTARSHSRYKTYPQNLSRHSHNSMLSNSVTLTHPYNPYNKSSKTAERVY